MYVLENQENLIIRRRLSPDHSSVCLKCKLRAMIPLVNSPSVGFVLAPAQQAEVQTRMLCSASISFTAHLTSASNICTMFCGITDATSKKKEMHKGMVSSAHRWRNGDENKEIHFSSLKTEGKYPVLGWRKQQNFSLLSHLNISVLVTCSQSCSWGWSCNSCESNFCSKGFWRVLGT